jgi:hypothetical protein
MVIPIDLASPLLWQEGKEKFEQALPSALSGIKLYVKGGK